MAESLSRPTRQKDAKKQAADAAVEDDSFTTVGKGGKAMQYTSESIFQNLQLIQEARGKKVCMHILPSDNRRSQLIFQIFSSIQIGLSKFEYWKSS